MRCALAIWLVLVGAARQSDAEEPELAKLKARVADLERALADVPSALARIDELEKSVVALQRQGVPEGAKGNTADYRAALDTLSSELAETRRRLAAVEGRSEWTPRIGYDHGVTLQAGTTRLTLTGGIQARAVGESLSGHAGVASVDLHHALLALDGEVGRYFAARLSVDFGNSYFVAAPFAPRGGIVRDAWIEVRPFSWLTLRAGQIIVPFGRQRQVSDLRLASPERSLATLAFALDRDLGAMIEARFADERLLVQAAVSDGINAGAPGARNDNLDLRWSGRVVISPLGPVPLAEGDPSGSAAPRFCVGGSALYDLVPTNDPVNPDRDGDGRIDNVEVIAAAGEAALSFGRFSGQAEVFYRRERYGDLAPMPLRSYRGVALQTQAVVVRDYAMVEAHFAWAEPHSLATAAGVGAIPPSPFGSGPVADASLLDAMIPEQAWQAGGSLVGLFRSHDLKLQLGLDWTRRSISVGELEALVLQIQATMAF
jgi:hypothetical protein